MFFMNGAKKLDIFLFAKKHSFFQFLSNEDFLQLNPTVYTFSLNKYSCQI